ncbi:MAG: hypothetical protein AB8B59_11310 [Maribacter sp.]
MKKKLNKKKVLGGLVLALVLFLIFMCLPVTVQVEIVALFGRFVGDLIRALIIIAAVYLIYLAIIKRGDKEE